MTEVFIVRFWFEPREIKDKKPALRGLIEHIDSGNKTYFKNLNELFFFIIPYLEEKNIELEIPWRLFYWLKKQQVSFHLSGIQSDKEANHDSSNSIEK